MQKEKHLPWGGWASCGSCGRDVGPSAGDWASAAGLHGKCSGCRCQKAAELMAPPGTGGVKADEEAVLSSRGAA